MMTLQDEYGIDILLRNECEHVLIFALVHIMNHIANIDVILFAFAYPIDCNILNIKY